jgi:hypothetical protein
MVPLEITPSIPLISRGDVQGKGPNLKTELVEKLNYYFVEAKLIQRG